MSHMALKVSTLLVEAALTGCPLVLINPYLQSQEAPKQDLGITAEELKQLQEQANLDFNRIAMLDEQNQALQVGTRKLLGSYMFA